MAKQFRGCSKLVYAIVTEGVDGTTYGTVKTLAPVKSVSREIAADNEDVWADNAIQEKTFAGTKVTRSFECTRLPLDVEAELLGYTSVSVGSGTSVKAYGTEQDGSNRPYIAVGYALHDGNAEQPCEIVWAFRGKVTNISKSASTIDDGTGSEGQTVDIEFIAPVNKFTKTGKRNLDIFMPVDETTDVDKWFKQVVTFDNIDTVLA